MKKKVITATAMMALAAMAMSGCGQSSAPAETTAAYQCTDYRRGKGILIGREGSAYD